MIFSILKSPALHNQMNKSQKRRTENALLLHIVFTRQSPETGWGHDRQISMFGWLLPSAGEGLCLDLREEEGGQGVCGGGSWVSLILNPEPHHPPVPFAPLALGSTQKCGCLCHCNLALFAKRFHCLLYAIGVCMNRSQQDAGWHHFWLAGREGVVVVVVGVWIAAFVISWGPFLLLFFLVSIQACRMHELTQEANMAHREELHLITWITARQQPSVVTKNHFQVSAFYW